MRSFLVSAGSFFLNCIRKYQGGAGLKKGKFPKIFCEHGLRLLQERDRVGSMKIYGLKNCDSCRAAVKSLTAAGTTIEFVDVRADGVPAGSMSLFYKEFGAALLNTRSTTWRGLSADERAKDPLELLGIHPTLMKRPIVEDGDKRTLGWAKTSQQIWGV
jgi:arsenate reductase